MRSHFRWERWESDEMKKRNMYVYANSLVLLIYALIYFPPILTQSSRQEKSNTHTAGLSGWAQLKKPAEKEWINLHYWTKAATFSSSSQSPCRWKDIKEITQKEEKKECLTSERRMESLHKQSARVEKAIFFRIYIRSLSLSSSLLWSSIYNHLSYLRCFSSKHNFFAFAFLRRSVARCYVWAVGYTKVGERERWRGGGRWWINVT